jgi:hypothetical protein
MLWHIYLRKGQVFVPTVSKTDAGLFLDTAPVAAHSIDDVSGIIAAVEAAIARGNPIVPTPTRGSFPAPVVLEYAKVKSWATFEKSAACWKIRFKDGSYQLCPMRKNASGGWEDDPVKIEIYSSAQSVARRAGEVMTQVG